MYGRYPEPKIKNVNIFLNLHKKQQENMKKQIFILILALLLPLSGLGQERVSSIHETYHPLSTGVSSAPQGYVPFYISHYGRHGSRYHAADKYLTASTRALSICDSLSLLTDEGRQVFEDILALDKAHEGMMGFLTQKGCAQHKEISSRMFGHYSKVFTDGSRRQVKCVSSPVQRCIQSMTGFCLELKGNSPALDFEVRTGERYLDVIIPGIHPIEKSYSARWQPVLDSMLVADADLSRITGRLFTSKEKVEKATGYPVQLLVRDIYCASTIIPNLDENLRNPFRFYTKEELSVLYRNWTSIFCLCWCSTVEAGDDPVRITGAGILRDIISKADSAVKEDSRVCADLRFGHDSGITPLLCALGAEGFDKVFSIRKGCDWNASELMCKASNVQMIFYRNGKGRILVKVLHNEKETALSGIKPVCGPYYDWSELRSHLLKKVNRQ